MFRENSRKIYQPFYKIPAAIPFWIVRFLIICQFYLSYFIADILC